MSLPPRLIRSAFTALLLISASALGGCAMNVDSGSTTTDVAATSGTAPPPPDLISPATDTSGKPLVEQPLSNEAIAAPSTGAVGEVDFSCRTDADCAIKNVGNCCGYYPACVNIDSPTFAEALMAQCAAEDRMAVCGFRDIAGCQCVEGRCQPLDQGVGPVR
ncbi:MAG: hypothetical protein KGZ36_01625 [Xanthomonadaceae bacterium]|nr:hypothetical protein [Silanimonas sp.]MBS3923964.1 hypothetical protein [Xanthomonadaceae bacterium]